MEPAAGSLIILALIRLSQQATSRSTSAKSELDEKEERKERRASAWFSA